jgi:sterol desaturase/sphingolipid hydroxylase (fatty acid hydroxylase superfamily)
VEPLSDPVLALLRGAYFGTLFGSFFFFLLWEGGAPRVAFVSAAARRRHVLRNLGMLGLVVLIADLVVGGWLLGTVNRIGAVSPGLLSRFDLAWPVLLAIGILAIDLFAYWWHRVCHAIPWLWRLHRVHHSDTHLDATTGARAHALETSLEIVVLVGAMLLAGIPLWVELVRTLFLNPLLLAQHANVTYPQWLERAACPLIVTPEIHRVHHSPIGAEQNSNFGQFFSIWDRLFGTYRTPPATTADVGVAGLNAERFQTLAGMCATPFLRA